MSTGVIDKTINIIDIIESSPRYGMFELRFSNSKKHGYKPIQTHHCQGTLYITGHCHLDTEHIKAKDFLALKQMLEYFDALGYFSILWISEIR